MPDNAENADLREPFAALLRHATGAFGLSVSDDDVRRMWTHFQLVVEANRRFNLTRITTPADAAVRHYADSLSVLACPELSVGPDQTILDVGTGAGFPAVPLAIARPDWHVTAIDGTGKKARFVQEAAEMLDLANLASRHVRAGDLSREPAARFDVVLLRAVAPLDRGLEEVRRLIRAQGQIVFYKSAGMPPAELESGRRMARRLGLCEPQHWALTIPAPGEALERRLVLFRRSDRPEFAG